MKRTLVTKPEIKLVGITVSTSYDEEVEKMEGKIFPQAMRFFQEKLYDLIPNRTHPGVTLCAYTDYESDYEGEYVYFIGEEVSSFGEEELKGDLQTLIIPKQHYAVFTTDPAPMPEVIVNAWEKIWEMTPEQLGGKRNYSTDFEIYDERAVDYRKMVIDIYVGITPV